MSRRAGIGRRAGLVLASASATALLAVAAARGLPPGLAGALPYLLPPVLLALLLAARRYPGERALLALTARRRSRDTPFHIGRVRLGPWPHVGLPRGGRLIASSLAVRPPPALLARS